MLGTVADCVAGVALRGEPTTFCLQYSLPKMSSYSFGKYGEAAAFRLAQEWVPAWSTTLTFLSLPFCKKGRDGQKKAGIQVKNAREKNKSLPFCPRSLHFCPKSLHFVFLKGSFDPQKGRDLKCKDLGQNARIFFHC